jgi:hypothetical protein
MPRFFAALPTSGNAQSIPIEEHHAQPLKHPDPSGDFAAVFGFSIRLIRVPASRSAPLRACGDATLRVDSVTES